jgi:hypothetical protein
MRKGERLHCFGAKYRPRLADKQNMTTRPALSTLTVLRLQHEAIAAGDDKAIVDCALILSEDVGPGDEEYDAAMARLCKVASEAHAKKLDHPVDDVIRQWEEYFECVD